jgi:hypothetical protein
METGVCGEHGGHAPWRVVVARGHDLDHEIYKEGRSVLLHFLVELESLYSFSKMSQQKSNYAMGKGF